MRLTGSTTATYSLFRKSDGIEKIRLLRLFARKLPLADFCTNICQVGWCRIHRPLQTDVRDRLWGSYDIITRLGKSGEPVMMERK